MAGRVIFEKKNFLTCIANTVPEKSLFHSTVPKTPGFSFGRFPEKADSLLYTTVWQTKSCHELKYF